MSWRLDSRSFHMTLAKQVPERVKEALPGLVSRFLARHGLYRSDVAAWAIHPGGVRIIEAAGAALELEPGATRHSREVFLRRGNMSSATLPHIWHAMREDDQLEDGALVCSLAFGPGLTITGNLLRKGG